MVERCALSGSDLKIKFRTILLTSNTTTMCDCVLHCLWFFLMFFWCPCMAINVNVQYNGGFLPNIILWTQCYLHRGTRFCICSL